MPLYNPPGGGAHPDLATHDALGLATDTNLSDHGADTTAVHGIADTAALSTTSHDHDADYEATGAVATHAGLADPHTGYQKESEKSAASGYASLDVGTKVPIAELPTGTTGTTVALGDAAAGLITTHEGAANPHPTYLTAAEGDAAYEALGATAAHTGDAADAHDASAVSVVPAGTIAATDVQAAIEELDTEKSGTAHTHTHAATTGQTADDHHNQAHVVTGADHTASGLTIGHVLTASSATAFGFAAPAGGNDPRVVFKNLGTDFVSAGVPVTTMTKATNLDQALSAGTWVFEYHCMWQTSATATAVKFGVNFSGVATRVVMEATGFEATTAASTGVETATHAAFGLRAGGQNNAFSVLTSIFGPTATAAANVDHYTVIRGLCVVTVAGNLELYFGSEATGSTQTLELPTSLVAYKIA
jgi:hypothetical protein